MLKLAHRFEKLPKDAIRVDVTTTTNSPFAPNRLWLNFFKGGSIGWVEYRKQYWRDLKKLYQKKPRIFHDLIDTSKDNDVYLVCWCRDEKRCHRLVLKKFLESLGRRL